MRPDYKDIRDVCRLCADCQRSCKQQACVIVVNCPLYVRKPRQGRLFDAGRAREARRSSSNRSKKGAPS